MCRRVLALCSDDCCDLHLARILNYPSFLPRPCLPAPASCTGVKVAPHFDSPFLATSLSNFWAHRWDLVAGNQLRNCVYAPIVEGVLTATERCLLAGHTHLLFLLGAAWLLVLQHSAMQCAVCAELRAQVHACGVTFAHTALVLSPLCPSAGQFVHSEPSPRRRSARLSAATATAPAAARQRRQRRLLGMAACFLVSGLMHEVQMWCAVCAVLCLLCLLMLCCACFDSPCYAVDCC